MSDLPGIRRIQLRNSVRSAESSEAKPIDVTTKIGLWVVCVLIVLYVMFRFPELGALVERYNQF
jgi:hypothetical protein